MPHQVLLAFGGDLWFNNLTIATAVAIVAIVLALAFDFVNGFNDTANTCATVIYTRALRPFTAILWSGTLNFLGALLIGTAVAQVIIKIIPAHTVSLSIIVAALMAALMWNLTTWFLSIPISSSHCLIGSLFGAGIMAAGVTGVAWGELDKVIIALIISPIIGFAFGGILTWVGIKIGKNTKNSSTLNAGKHNHQPVMRWLHVFACSLVAFSHGSNDGQKTMGIVTLILATHFSQYGYTIDKVPFWVILACAIAIGLGITLGGWRVIKTVGTKISKQPITHAQGFGASMATALVILIASKMGAPISTTHTLNSAVAGGTVPSYGMDKLNLKTIRNILTAWVLTVPATAALAAICYSVIRLVLE